MPDTTPVKTLFQFNEKLDKRRIVVLLSKDTLLEMLAELERTPTTGAVAAGNIPIENLGVVVEAYVPETAEKSKLIYTKCLTEREWTTTHVNLL